MCTSCWISRYGDEVNLTRCSHERRVVCMYCGNVGEASIGDQMG
jgi:hypothetical protein